MFTSASDVLHELAELAHEHEILGGGVSQLARRRRGLARGLADGGSGSAPNATPLYKKYSPSMSASCSASGASLPRATAAAGLDGASPVASSENSIFWL